MERNLVWRMGLCLCNRENSAAVHFFLSGDFICSMLIRTAPTVQFREICFISACVRCTLYTVYSACTMA